MGHKTEKIFSRGAEAIIYLKTPSKRTNNKLKENSSLTSKNQRRIINESKNSKQPISSETRQFVIKDRIKKSYRLPELDEKIRKLRTRSEAKILEKASRIINTPIPQESKEKYKITMPFIKGKKLSEDLNEFPLSEQKQILNQIGKEIAKLHDSNIIHGDLTTSNMIYVFKNELDKKNKLTNNTHNKTIREAVCPLTNKSSAKHHDKVRCEAINSKQREPIIYFIDFGLGFHSQKYEDKAVDIHLLKQALEAKHFQNWEILFKEFLKGYKNSKDSEVVLKQFEKVEKRGRYKEH